MADEKSDGSEAEGNQMHFYGHLSEDGRIYVPLRHRQRVGLTEFKGAECEVLATIKSIF